MSESFLAAAAARSDDGPTPAASATNPRGKIAVLSEKVVDTNPYSRLMCAQNSSTQQNHTAAKKI